MPRYLHNQTKICLNERTIQMTDDEIKELSGMKVNEDCCLFCESRCPDCGSINIVAKYRRYYQIDFMKMKFEHSDAQVYCYDCIPEINDESIYSIEGVFMYQWEVYDDILEGIWSPELVKQLDTLFDDFEQHGLPSDLQEEIDEQIGEYKFLKRVFLKSHEYLLNLSQNTPDWIVIDEIGFLELDGMGFEPAVSQLINKLQTKSEVHILMVVRDFLKEKVIEYYKINSDSCKDFNPDKPY